MRQRLRPGGREHVPHGRPVHALVLLNARSGFRRADSRHRIGAGVFVFGAWVWSIWIATPVAAATLVGDGGDASHELARFCHRHRRHVTLVSRFHADANLYDPPSANGAREHRSDVSGSARASGLYHSAQLVQAKRAAHGAVFAWFVQSRQSDLCATWPPARHETHRAPVVRQDGHQFQRRDHRGPSIVLGNGFERVAESCGYHKTSETFTPHTAGSPEPGRVRPGKDGKSRAKRRSPFSHANVILPDDSGLSARRRVRIRARE